MGVIKRNIPNFITCLNLLMGCIGIAMVSQGFLIHGAFCIFIAAFFDLLDGLIARVLKVESKIGKDLDSLADVVSFGVLPALIVFNILQSRMKIEFFPNQNLMELASWAAYAAFIIPIFSAIRLARFNNDPEQKFHFKGLPVPASGLIWASFALSLQTCLPQRPLKMPWIMEPTVALWDCGEFIPSTYQLQNQIPCGPDSSWLTRFYFNPWFLFLMILLTCFLMVSPLKLIAMKIHQFSFKKYLMHFILLILSLITIFFLGFASAPIILILYIILSQIHFRTKAHEI